MRLTLGSLALACLTVTAQIAVAQPGTVPPAIRAAADAMLGRAGGVGPGLSGGRRVARPQHALAWVRHGSRLHHGAVDPRRAEAGRRSRRLSAALRAARNARGHQRRHHRGGRPPVCVRPRSCHAVTGDADQRRVAGRLRWARLGDSRPPDRSVRRCRRERQARAGARPSARCHRAFGYSSWDASRSTPRHHSRPPPRAAPPVCSSSPRPPTSSGGTWSRARTRFAASSTRPSPRPTPHRP